MPRPRRRPRAPTAWLALLAVSLLAACGANPDAQTREGPDANGTSIDAPSRASGVFFPQVREGLEGGPDAGMGGKLVLDERGCLRLQPGDVVPVWPANLRLETAGETVRVKDGEGRTVAEVGKEVFMGGGQIGLPTDVVSPSTTRELRNRCPGDLGGYWIAVAPSMSLAVPQGRSAPGTPPAR